MAPPINVFDILRTLNFKTNAVYLCRCFQRSDRY